MSSKNKFASAEGNAFVWIRGHLYNITYNYIYMKNVQFEIILHLNCMPSEVFFTHSVSH